jgi:hypothetical protein
VLSARGSQITLGGDPSCGDGVDEGLVVALVLVGVASANWVMALSKTSEPPR